MAGLEVLAIVSLKLCSGEDQGQTRWSQACFQGKRMNLGWAGCGPDGLEKPAMGAGLELLL